MDLPAVGAPHTQDVLRMDQEARENGRFRELMRQVIDARYKSSLATNCGTLMDQARRDIERANGELTDAQRQDLWNVLEGRTIPPKSR